MNLAESNLERHRMADFLVWLDSGEERLCIITYDTDEKPLVGFFSKETFKQIQYFPHAERVAFIKSSRFFVRIVNVTRLKTGFIMSRVAFRTEQNEKLLGKTDKGFTD